MFNLGSLSTGAFSEVKGAITSITQTVEAEFAKDRARLLSLESKAAAGVTKAVADVRADLPTLDADVKIAAHHVGMTLRELLESLAHPVAAGAALLEKKL
jgi:hypothetical protein